MPVAQKGSLLRISHNNRPEGFIGIPVLQWCSFGVQRQEIDVTSTHAAASARIGVSSFSV